MNFTAVKEDIVSNLKERQKLFENIVAKEDIDWIGKAIYHLMRFYNSLPDKSIYKKSKETDISLAIRDWVRNDDNIVFHLDLFVVDVEARSFGKKEGYYDIKFEPPKLLWGKYISFEAKLLSASESKINQYVYVESKGKPNGGVYRYIMNEKYSAKQNFGGMLGYIQSGKPEKVIEKVKTKLKSTSQINLQKPETLLLKEKIPNYFESLHKRIETDKNEIITLYHLFLDFT